VPPYDLFVLEVVAAWIDPARRHARTLPHQGQGHFILDGETVVLPSSMP
jgi:hypothetical protein